MNNRYTFSLLALLFIIMCTGQSLFACWDSIDINEQAKKSPVIVTGTITSIENVQKKGNSDNDKGYWYAIAHISVDEVLKNQFTDIDISKELLAHMNSGKARIRISTAISYPVGSKGVWLIFVDNEGKFSINSFPGQLQPLKTKEKFRDNTEASLTKEQWLANKEKAREEARLKLKQEMKKRLKLAEKNKIKKTEQQKVASQK